MKKHEKRPLHRTRLFAALFSVAAVIALYAGTAGGLKSEADYPDSQLTQDGKSESDVIIDRIRDEKIAELESAQGQYCEDSIVLNDIDRDEAKRIAKEVGAKVRVTDDGQYAVLYLPEGVTIEDVYKDKDNRLNMEKCHLIIMRG